MSDEVLTRFYHLDGQGGAKVIDHQAVEKWSPGAGPLWLRCDLTEVSIRRWLSDSEDLPEAAIDTLLAAGTRPRFELFDGGMLLVLRGVNLNPGAEADDMVAVRMWLDRDRIITSQRRPLRSASDLAADLERGQGPRRPSDVLSELMERLAEFLESILEGIFAELENAEDLIESDPSKVLRSGINALRRRTARIRRFLLPQREALERLCRQSGGWLDTEQVDSIQSFIDGLTRHLEDLDLARERAQLVHEELQNRVAQQQNSRVYLLSIVTVIFLPLTFVTGLLGMNVAGLPGTDDPAAFWLVCGISLGVAIVLALVFRIRRWL